MVTYYLHWYPFFQLFNAGQTYAYHRLENSHKSLLLSVTIHPFPDLISTEYGNILDEPPFLPIIIYWLFLHEQAPLVARYELESPLQPYSPISFVCVHLSAHAQSLPNYGWSHQTLFPPRVGSVHESTMDPSGRKGQATPKAGWMDRRTDSNHQN